MSIESKHPDYLEVADDYRVMRDTFKGERRIKQGGFAYLPPTAGQVKDGARNSASSAGALAYESYLARAQFPEFVREAVGLLVGVMHQEPAVIELPEALEPIRKSATREGADLQMLLRKINEQQLLFGRFGMLLDFPQDPFFASQSRVPHIVEYEAEMIINWDDERLTEFTKNMLTFAVLNETVEVRGREGANVFDWQEERRYRVLQLAPEDPNFPASAGNEPVYTTFVETDDVVSEVVAPQYRGQTLDFIPFVVVGANDLEFTPDEIPLLGLANLALAIYRQEADYKQALHVLGQDTLLLVGQEIGADGQAKDESEETRIGAGAVIRLDEGGSGEFIGINAEGVPEMRTSLENDKSRALAMGPRLLEPRRGQAESGEALQTRVSASTATLKTIALTGAAGLEMVLKMAARWIGADEREVSVKPNLDFTQDTVNSAEAKSLVEAKEAGLKLSDRSIHKWLQEKNFTRNTFETERLLLAAEEAETITFSQAERLVGRTDEADDHAHNYLLFRFPDGSFHGITSFDDEHFHEINGTEETEEAQDHRHPLLAPSAAAEAPADDSTTPPDEGDGDPMEE